MKILYSIAITALSATITGNLFAEPLFTSWYTDQAGSYARIWQSIEDETTEKTTGVTTSVTTWDAASTDGRPLIGSQTAPIYAGIQGVYYSTDSVYIKATGLGIHTMGPWYDNADKTELFPSWPANAAILYSFPRVTDYAEDYESPMDVSGLGTNGVMVDGVPIFNSSDGASYDDAGDWNQDAFFNEGTTFDSANAHQAAEAHHYHANPAALRHLLGDSVDYDSSVVFTGLISNGKNNPYSEVFNGDHSPIIGWINDGLPIYGPYGYSEPMDATSSVRRMTSGYQMRDGSNGSYNLADQAERDLLPQWSVDLNRAINSTTPASNGPAVDDTGRYRLGTFIEDYAYKGDLTKSIYTDGGYDEDLHFDLNRFNVRYCVTPDFPDGTWAYFTCIDEDGTPVYPYNVANNYFGIGTSATGVAAIPTTETITTVFDGAESKGLTVEDISTDTNNELTIIWDAIEGGVYRIDTSSTLEAGGWAQGEEFTSDAQIVTAVDDSSINSGTEKLFYRLVQTGISEYDETEFSTATTTGGGNGPGGGGPP